MIALFVVAIPGNITTFSVGLVSNRHLIFSLPRDPLAQRVPRSIRPEPITAPWVTIGWLLDGAHSGRIPAARLTAQDLRSDAFPLSFVQHHMRRSADACRSSSLLLPLGTTLRRGDLIGIYEGAAHYPGFSDSITITPGDPRAPGPVLIFAASDGSDITVLRDVGSTRLRASSPFFAPRVCILRDQQH